jgi:hypothetical protein
MQILFPLYVNSLMCLIHFTDYFYFLFTFSAEMCVWPAIFSLEGMQIFSTHFLNFIGYPEFYLIFPFADPIVCLCHG